MEKDHVFVEIDSSEWHNFAAEAVKDFGQRIVAQKKQKKETMALLAPWGSLLRVIDVSETMEGLGYINPNHNFVVWGNFCMWDLLSRYEIKGKIIFSPKKEEK